MDLLPLIVGSAFLIALGVALFWVRVEGTDPHPEESVPDWDWPPRNHPYSHVEEIETWLEKEHP